MSVINKMLQDLESRRGGLESETAAAAPVRPAGVVYERRSPKIAIFIAAGVLLVGLLAWFVLRALPKSPQAESTAIVAMPPSAPLAPVANPPSATPAPVISPPAPKVVAKAPADVAIMPPAALEAESRIDEFGSNSAKGTPGVLANPDQVVKSPPPKSDAAVPPQPTESAPLATANTDVITPSEKSTSRSRGKSNTAGFDAEPQNFKNRTPQQRTDERYRDALRKLNEGQASQARNELMEVLQTQPKHSGARLTLVGIELDDKHAAQAERLLRDGIQLQPQESTFSMALARLEVERGDVATGLATLNRGLPNAGDDPEYHAFMAALLQRTNRHAEAIEHYQVALRQREAANWLVGLGISLEGANRAREAEQIYRRAQQSNALPSDLQEFVAQRLLQLKS